MKYLRYSEDRIPVTLIFSIFACDVLVWIFATNIFLVLAWFVMTLPAKIAFCCWNHHHQHLATFHSRFLNRLLEFVYAFHTGITTNAWVLHHNLGHHVNYLDQTLDESGWKRRDGSKMGEWEYTLKIAVTGYFRALKVGLRHSRHLASFLSMAGFTFLVFALLLYLNWSNTLLIFGLPMFIGYIITCWHTYSHHAGLDTADPYHASHNIMHPWYNWATGNLGYHTAHHVKPGLHWSSLPEFHATIADKIPAHLYVDPPLLFRLFRKA